MGVAENRVRRGHGRRGLRPILNEKPSYGLYLTKHIPS